MNQRRAFLGMVVLVIVIAGRSFLRAPLSATRVRPAQHPAESVGLAGQTSATASTRTSTQKSETESVEAAGIAREACIVTTVHDGDTIRCRGDKRVRLLLVDAPELDQPGGTDSRDALSRILVSGDTVWLEYDIARTDQYGRTLAYVWTQRQNGILANLAQAQNGWATVVVFPPNVKRVEQIRSAVAAARLARRGMWAATRVCEPIDHKKGRC